MPRASRRERRLKCARSSHVQGDIQTSATLAFVMRERLDLPSSTMARLTSAYISELIAAGCTIETAPTDTSCRPQTSYELSIAIYLRPTSPRTLPSSLSEVTVRRIRPCTRRVASARRLCTTLRLANARSARQQLRSAASGECRCFCLTGRPLSVARSHRMLILCAPTMFHQPRGRGP